MSYYSSLELFLLALAIGRTTGKGVPVQRTAEPLQYFSIELCSERKKGFEKIIGYGYVVVSNVSYKNSIPVPFFDTQKTMLVIKQ